MALRPIAWLGKPSVSTAGPEGPRNNYEWDYYVVPRIAGACVCSRAITFNAGARAGLTTRNERSRAERSSRAQAFLVCTHN